MSDTSAVNSPQTRRVLTASLVGTAVEFYDFYIYATAATLVFPAVFFAGAPAAQQLLFSYATFAIGFIARPVGAIFFGHFGDRIGRKSTLVASLLVMGGSTMAIAFLPTYALAGWVAPALLCLMRFGQGFGLGGEWGGAALLAVENAPPGYKARFGMFPQLGAPVGFIAANGFFLLLGLFMSAEQFESWGWRVPFLASAVLVGIGLWVRLSLTETPAFKAALEAAPPSKVPLGEVLTNHWREVLGGIFGVVACFCIYYIATAFSLGYGVGKLGYSREAFLGVQLAAILFMAGGIVWAGYWADATSPRRVLMAGCILAVGAGFLLSPLLGSGSLLLVGVFLSIALLLMGFVYGPLGAWLPGLFPARVRYTGASLAFNVGGIIGGGLTPLIAETLVGKGGLQYVGFYLSAAAALSLAALFLLKTKPAEDLMPSDNDHLQAIGAAALAVAEGLTGKLLVYAEVEDGVISADVFYASQSGDVKFRFASPPMKDLIYEFWEQEKNRPDGHEWRTMSYVVENGRFTVDLKYPNQINPKQDLSDRRPDVVMQHFGSMEVDYSKPE